MSFQTHIQPRQKPIALRYNDHDCISSFRISIHLFQRPCSLHLLPNTTKWVRPDHLFNWIRARKLQSFTNWRGICYACIDDYFHTKFIVCCSCCMYSVSIHEWISWFAPNSNVSHWIQTFASTILWCLLVRYSWNFLAHPMPVFSDFVEPKLHRLTTSWTLYFIVFRYCAKFNKLIDQLFFVLTPEKIVSN